VITITKKRFYRQRLSYAPANWLCSTPQIFPRGRNVNLKIKKGGTHPLERSPLHFCLLQRFYSSTRVRALWGLTFRTEMSAHKHGICSMTTVVRCPRTGHACSEGACRERHWCRQLFERGLSHRGLPLKRKFRPRCCAKTRAGAPCIMGVVPGKRRCRFHGGMSTGPRTKAEESPPHPSLAARLRARS
jgi:hypothetical protein